MPPLENLFPLVEASDRLPRKNGRKISKSTVFRWSSKGLRTVMLGGQRYTCEEWFWEFIEARSGGTAAAAAPRTPRARQRAIDQAERELDRLGV